MKEWRTISGDFYDGDRLSVPEKPWIVDYSKTLTMKVALSRPDLAHPGESIVICNFNRLRRLIRELDELTRGIPKILYLVGWQYEGHDTGYPAFHEVNPDLAEKGEDPREVLSSIMKESLALNTRVSLHINMTDAYPDSPLWKLYRDEDLISRRRGGRLLVTGRWYGRKAYQVCYSREWDAGRAVQRIDALMELLPLETVGTIHIDAFFCRPNAYHRISRDEEQKSRRRIIRYWRSRGVDVTSEFLYKECGRVDLIGLVPMVWHLNQSARDYMNRPASLLTGGAINHDLRGDKKLDRLFGESTRGEDHFADGEFETMNPRWVGSFMDDFFCNALPWQYLNSLKRVALNPVKRVLPGAVSAVFQSRDPDFDYLLVTEKKEKKISLRQGGREYGLRRGDTLCFPALWSDSVCLGLYSREGKSRGFWSLPPEWLEDGPYTYHPVNSESAPRSLQVRKGEFELPLSPGEGGWITK